MCLGKRHHVVNIQSRRVSELLPGERIEPEARRDAATLGIEHDRDETLSNQYFLSRILAIPICIDPVFVKVAAMGDPTITDKQQGWNDALNIVIDKFCDVAWREELVQERERAAADMEKLVEYKCRGKSEDYQQTMAGLVGPFCKMLKGISQPEPPFNIKFPEAERQGRNDALEIVLDEFRGFAHRAGLKLEWTCSEIAGDMEKLVEYEDRGKSEDYQQTMADVVRPFYKMLKSEPQRKPPFNT